METFNELLQSLPFQFDIRTKLEDDLARLNPDDQARLRMVLPINDLVLYYPISYYDEFGLSPVKHHVVTALDLIEAIKESYRAEVPKATLEYYVKNRPKPYQEIVEGTRLPIPLSNLIGGRYYIDSISPSQSIDSIHPRFFLNLIF